MMQKMKMTTGFLKLTNTDKALILILVAMTGLTALAQQTTETF